MKPFLFLTCWLYIPIGFTQPLTIDDLEGTYQLAYTHSNGEVRAVEENECGFSEILEIQVPRKLKYQDTWSQSVLLRGVTDVWICGVNPETYKIELSGNSCNTDIFQSKDDPTIWFFRGPSGSHKMRLEILEAYLFFSLIESMDNEPFTDPLFDKKETIVYQKIAKHPFRNRLEKCKNK